MVSIAPPTYWRAIHNEGGCATIISLSTAGNSWCRDKRSGCSSAWIPPCVVRLFRNGFRLIRVIQAPGPHRSQVVGHLFNRFAQLQRCKPTRRNVGQLWIAKIPPGREMRLSIGPGDRFGRRFPFGTARCVTAEGTKRALRQLG
jgi:hypothetical protein